MNPIKAWGVLSYDPRHLAHGWYDEYGCMKLSASIYRLKRDAIRAVAGEVDRIVQIEIREVPKRERACAREGR